MQMLLQLQRELIRAIVANAPVSSAALHAQFGGAERLPIYSHSWRGSLRKALRLTYPVIEKLVGADFFEYATDCYIDEHPSRCQNLDEYGREFADFLRQFAPAQSLPYLGDVAMLELAIDTLAMAAGDTPPLQIESAYPILKIWQTNQPGWSGEQIVDLEAGPDCLHLWCEQGEVFIEKARQL